jgi:hypothetical protein
MLMRALPILALTLTALAAPAQASTASAPGRAAIASPGGIEILSNTVFPLVSSGDGSAAPAVAGNAALTIRSQTGSVLSMAVPTSFQVIRSGATEGLTVTTTTDANLQLSRGGVVLGGPGLADGAFSVKVGGLVALGGGAISPGPYEGLVVVLVQFN